jgi:hypothetical protein
MSRRRTAAPAAAFLLLTALACGEPAAPAGKFNQAVSLAVLSGANQSAPEFTELPEPIVVQILNAKGKPVVGQLVNFRAVQGGGSVYAGAAFTDNLGIARDWWTIGGAFSRNLLEARAVDPATGAQIILATVLAFPQALDNPRIQFKCGNQPNWQPPNSGPLAGECYGTSNIVPSYANGASVQVRVRVVHGATDTPVPHMWLDLYASHAESPSTGPSVTPVYVVTDANGEASLVFTIGSRRILNTLSVIGPNGIQGYQDFRAGY